MKNSETKSSPLSLDTLVISKRSISSIFGLIASLGFTYLQFVGYILPGFKELYMLELGAVTINNIGLIWVPIITYILIGLIVCLSVNIFKKLKGYEEKGLIMGLISGFFVVVFGSLVHILIVDSFLGVITGTIGGLLFAVYVGLKEEFKTS